MRDFVFHGVELVDFPGFPGLDATPDVASLTRLRWHCLPGLSDAAATGLVREHASGFVIEWGGYARYEVALGGGPGRAEVIREGIDEDEAARGFLLSVLPVALPLFGLEPLHGAAVEVDDRVTLILGPSGSGKSSIASGIASLGHRLLSDDACAIDEQLRIWPGPPLVTPRWPGSGLPLVGEYNGKVVRVGSGGPRRPREVGSVLVLKPTRDEVLKLSGLTPTRAFPAILGNARYPDVFTVRRRERQFQVASGLSRRSCAELCFDPDNYAPDILASYVVDQIRAGYAA